VIDASDVDFLKDTFGVRLELNEDGGHLGNLWRPEVQDRVMSRLLATVPIE